MANSKKLLVLDAETATPNKNGDIILFDADYAGLESRVMQTIHGQKITCVMIDECPPQQREYTKYSKEDFTVGMNVLSIHGYRGKVVQIRESVDGRLFEDYYCSVRIQLYRKPRNKRERKNPPLDRYHFMWVNPHTIRPTGMTPQKKAEREKQKALAWWRDNTVATIKEREKEELELRPYQQQAFVMGRQSGKTSMNQIYTAGTAPWRTP